MAGSPTMAWSSGETPQILLRPPGPPLLLATGGALKEIGNKCSSQISLTQWFQHTQTKRKDPHHYAILK